MKQLLIFFISAFISLSINTFGQNTYTGKIVVDANPCPPSDDPCKPGLVLWLETATYNYVLTRNSSMIWNDKFIINDIEYFEDDDVEITGTVSERIDMHSKEYLVLEIETIKKLSTQLLPPSPLPSNKRVVYDEETKQIIIIDKTLYGRSVVLELFDLHGKIALKKMDIEQPVSLAGFPNGIYLCRIVQDGQLIDSVKILKR